jgi:hypothetical protein
MFSCDIGRPVSPLGEGRVAERAASPTAGWLTAKNTTEKTAPPMTPADNKNVELGPKEVAELQRLAHSRPTSGREAAAKAPPSGRWSG